MTAAPLLDVHIIAFPLGLFERSRRHMEALLREFEFIAGEREHHETPARLLALVEDVTARFGGLNIDTEERVDAAVERGEESVDLVYRIPAAARDASMQLNDMLDEADAFCREGELLTLETPPELVAFRRWFLGEFVRQLAGEAPAPWTGR